MARPKKIDQLKMDGYGVTVDIYLDKDDGVFHAEYQGKRVHGTELARVRQELTQVVRDAHNILWHPFIEVRFFKPQYTQAKGYAGFEFEKLYLGQKGSEVAKADAWIIEEGHFGDSYTGSRYLHWKGPVDPTRTCATKFVGDEYVVLPYSDEVYERLGLLEGALETLRTTLHELVGGGPERILTAGLGALMLPSSG